ncbi:MAG TPA: response regulator [Aggregatilineaceae bacterium]|nr:response regulator [Aggregatilineaceae bacterium]
MTQALIIDNDASSIEVLQRLLVAQNVECTTILNPSQLEIIRENSHKADVIFLDLEMPHINGFEVFKVLHSEIGSTVPIVAYTVHTSEINMVRDLGFHSFLGKPLEAARFPDQLAQILSGKSVWEP